MKRIVDEDTTVDWTAVLRYSGESLDPNGAGKEDRVDYYVAGRVKEGVMTVPEAYQVCSM